MYAVVRSYTGQGASELFDLLGQREADVQSLLSGVPGFVNYVAVRTGDGGVTVTVCEDKAGTDESSRRAAEWVGVTDFATATQTQPGVLEGLGYAFRWDGSSPSMTLLPLSAGSTPTQTSSWEEFRRWYPGIKEGRLVIANPSAEPVTVTLRTDGVIHSMIPFRVTINEATNIPGAGVGVSDLFGNLLDGNDDGLAGGVFRGITVARPRGPRQLPVGNRFGRPRIPRP